MRQTGHARTRTAPHGGRSQGAKRPETGTVAAERRPLYGFWPTHSRAAGRGRLVQPVSDTALNRTTAKAQTCRLQGHAGPAGRSSLTPSYPHRGAPGPACRLWSREGWQAASPGWTAWHLGPSTRPRRGTGPCPLLGDHSRGTPTLSGTVRPHHVSPGQAVVCPPGGVVCP